MIELGGGLLICKTALQWLNDSDSSMGGKENRTVDPVALSKISSQIFYPLTSPHQHRSWYHFGYFHPSWHPPAPKAPPLLKSAINYAIIAVVILIMCSILYLFLSQGKKNRR